MIPMLYDCFKHWAAHGSVYLISDPHFDDEDCLLMHPRWPSPQDYVDYINKHVHKNDTLICLGDVGNIEWVSKLKAGHKVLIKGNHDDKSDKYYKRKIQRFKYIGTEYSKEMVYSELQERYPKDKISVNFNLMFNYDAIVDNNLFDEVYAGPLMIAPKILLSHEPISLPFVLNIHGHDHGWEKITTNNSVNICSNVVDWGVTDLKDIIKQGYVSKVKDIHRNAIDIAKEKKESKNEVF